MLLAWKAGFFENPMNMVSLAAVFVSAAAVIIAFLQWRVAANKFKFDVYEKRLAVYNDIHLFLHSIGQHKYTLDPEIANVFMKVNEAKFLLRPEDSAYLFKLLFRCKTIIPPADSNPEEYKERMARARAIYKEIHVLDDIFIKYLSVK